MRQKKRPTDIESSTPLRYETKCHVSVHVPINYYLFLSHLHIFLPNNQELTSLLYSHSIIQQVRTNMITIKVLRISSKKQFILWEFYSGNTYFLLILNLWLHFKERTKIQCFLPLVCIISYQLSRLQPHLKTLLPLQPHTKTERLHSNQQWTHYWFPTWLLLFVLSCTLCSFYIFRTQMN